MSNQKPIVVGSKVSFDFKGVKTEGTVTGATGNTPHSLFRIELDKPIDDGGVIIKKIYKGSNQLSTI